MTTVFLFAIGLGVLWLFNVLRPLKSDAPKITPAIEVREDGSVRCQLNSPTLNQWLELVVVGAKVRTITMKRERPLVTIHVRGKYFVFLQGDGLLCSERSFEAYDLFEKNDSWIISEIDGSYVILHPKPYD